MRCADDVASMASASTRHLKRSKRITRTPGRAGATSRRSWHYLHRRRGVVGTCDGGDVATSLYRSTRSQKQPVAMEFRAPQPRRRWTTVEKPPSTALYNIRPAQHVDEAGKSAAPQSTNPHPLAAARGPLRCAMRPSSTVIVAARHPGQATRRSRAQRRGWRSPAVILIRFFAGLAVWYF